MISCLLTDSEKNLHACIAMVKYGSIFDVLLEPGEKVHSVEVSESFKALLDELREGTPNLDTLTVHQGQPVYGEAKGSYLGFSYNKKILFKRQV